MAPDSEAAKAIDKEFWVQKDIEKTKVSATEIVGQMRSEGYPLFNMYHHTQLWKSLDAKNSGFGCQLGCQFWWYENWLAEVREHCEANLQKYREE